MSPAQSSEPLTVCVVAHTHWDREWYHPASRFRQRLVALVDSLLANATGATTPFLLDGQTVILEDYMSVRPEQTARLLVMLHEGALEAGPWYVLADGLIPSGEAIVRNLLEGRRILRRLGANLKSPAVAYCPDTFGHAQAMPLIARGFGFEMAIAWRGYGSARAPRGDTVRWRSDDGSEVLLYHLPPDGYETGSALPNEGEKMRERWTALRPVLANRSNTGVVLLPNGADHHALQPDFATVLSILQRVASPDTMLRESLRGFAQRLVIAAQQRELPVISGELRDSYGYTWTLGGTYGTRAHQKRANARAERALLRDVEPWLVLAWLHGRADLRDVSVNSSITLAQAPALLSTAWRTLLRAHPHDTLCGCSIDAVARSMDEHVASAREQARGLRAVALNMAMHHDAIAARNRPLSSESSVVVRNRASYSRGGVAQVLLDETLADVPVGPSSAVATTDTLASATARAVNTPTIRDRVVQRLSSRLVYRRRESPQHYPDNDLVREHRALVWMPMVPPLGVTVRSMNFVFESGPKRTPQLESFSESNAPDTLTAPLYPFHPSVGHHSPDGVELSNGRLTVCVSDTGIRLVQGKRSIANVLTFESSRDVGDSYTPAIRGDAEILNLTRFKLTDTGPLRSSVRVWYATAEGPNVIRVQANLSLDAEANALRVEIRGDNRRCNHRLRVNFRTDVLVNELDKANVDVWADAAFGPVLRAPLNVPAHDQLREAVPPTMPMHRWATLASVTNGATLHSDGLAEVEANPSNGVISLTLLRAIGKLSRNNLPERPGHAGWPAKIPLAQSRRTFRAVIGFQLHDAWSQETRDDIERASDTLLLPLTGGTSRDLEHSHLDITGPSLVGVALRASAVKLADDDDGIVLRCVNDSHDISTGSWALPTGPFQFAFARLDETLVSDWQMSDGPIAFTAPPRGVVTIRARHLAP